jgi:aryl-alcohol dehydrogenase-like predicted oxidoreductase
MPAQTHPEMQYRTLGRTGETVSLLGLGGWHIGFAKTPEPEAIRIIHAAIDRGVTFMDNSWDYNKGLSEIRMGNALAVEGYRHKVLLMTKIDGRSKKAAAEQIDQSLFRLKTDHIDLVQFHEVIRFEDPNRIFDEREGAIASFREAQQAGKLRYIGFTGHKDPHIHMYMLDIAKEHGFHFDTVQMPLNVMDAHFRSFGKTVLPRLIEEGIGPLAMKTLANGSVLRSGTVTAIEALHFSMNLPVSVVIAGMDTMEVLEQGLEAVRTFSPMPQETVDALLERTAQAASKGEFEPFKTSSIYDSTATNPDTLGKEPERLTSLMQA